MTMQLAVTQPLKLTPTQIDDMISNIASRGSKLDADIQSCALSIILHIEEHGDISKANKLYNAMPKGSRRNALVEWFITFGKLNISDKEDKRKNPLVYGRNKLTNLQGGMDKPWYECKKEQPADIAFDVEAQLKVLLKRIENAKKEGKEIKTGKVDIKALAVMVAA